MNKYLVTKLAEEGSEVAQAACKVLLHRDQTARRCLIREMADAYAMTNIALERMTKAERKLFFIETEARRVREEKKGKA